MILPKHNSTQGASKSSPSLQSLSLTNQIPTPYARTIAPTPSPYSPPYSPHPTPRLTRPQLHYLPTETLNSATLSTSKTRFLRAKNSTPTPNSLPEYSRVPTGLHDAARRPWMSRRSKTHISCYWRRRLSRETSLNDFQGRSSRLLCLLVVVLLGWVSDTRCFSLRQAGKHDVEVTLRGRELNLQTYRV